MELLPDPRYGYQADNADDFEGSQHDTEDYTSASPTPRPFPVSRSRQEYEPTPRGLPTQEDPDQYLRVPRRVAVRRGPLPESLSGRILFISSSILAFVLLGALAYAIAHYLLHDDHFRLASQSAIQLTGDQHTSHAQLMEVFSHDAGRNVFSIPLSDRRAALESNPWVAHATVMRLLPNRLRVSIVERTPVAYTRNGNSIALVDATGAIMNLPRTGLAAWSLPVVVGITPDLPLSTRAVRMATFNNFVAAVDSAGPPLSRKLSEVDLTDPDDLRALVPEDGMDVLVHFGNSDYLSRFQSFEQHLPEWRQQYPHLASADMRYDHQVVLDMDPNSATPSAAALASAEKAAKLPELKISAPPVPAPVAKSVPAPAAKSAPIVKTPPATKTSAAKPSPAVTQPSVSTGKPAAKQPAIFTAKSGLQKPSAARPELTVMPMPAPAPSTAQNKIQTRPAPAIKKPAAQQKSQPRKTQAKPLAKSTRPVTRPAAKPAAHTTTKPAPAKKSGTHNQDAPMVLPSINSSASNAPHHFTPARVSAGGLQ